MDADIALADLASGMAVPIRAECGCGVHAGPPGFVWKHTKRSMAGPLFSLQVSFTTVKWGAIYLRISRFKSARMAPIEYLMTFFLDMGCLRGLFAMSVSPACCLQAVCNFLLA